MTYNDIACYALINDVDTDKVNDLADSMIENGWVGCPILVYGEELLTGSHRLAALHEVERRYLTGKIDEVPEVLTCDIAEDVTEIVEENIAKAEEKNGYAPEIEYDNLGWMLEGSWVEEYKDEMEEWGYAA